MSAPCPTFGFVAEMELRPELDPVERDQLWDAWIAFLESRGLYCGGGGGDLLEYLIASEAAQATDVDRSAARSWLATRSELRAWRVGELIDLEQDV